MNVASCVVLDRNVDECFISYTLAQVALARIGQGVADAACSPFAASILRDHFGPELIGSAIGALALTGSFIMLQMMRVVARHAFLSARSGLFTITRNSLVFSWCLYYVMVFVTCMLVAHLGKQMITLVKL